MLTSSVELQALLELFHQGRKVSYTKGEYVIRPGESPPGVFYIESGLVKAYDITKYGEENLLVIRKAGDLLGITWAVTGEERPIIYTALKDSVVWQISRSKFNLHLKTHPEAALPLVDILTEMYKMHSSRIINLEYRTVRERLISFLLSTSEHFGKPVPGGTLIDAPLRHQDIASSINSSRETTSREMAYLERKDLVKSEQLYITIKNKKGLEKYL